MNCGAKWKKCNCPWFSDVHWYGQDTAMPIRHVRSDPWPPTGSRGLPGFDRAFVVPVRSRPRNYQEEMHVRRLQESGDADLAHHMQYRDDYHDGYGYGMMGELGDVCAIGNAARQYMDDDYRRAGSVRYRTSPPIVYGSSDHGDVSGRSSGRRPGVRERRRSGSAPATGPSFRGGKTAASPPSVPSPPRRPLRHRGAEGELYNSSPSTSRSERVVASRFSREYRDEAEIHRPARYKESRGYDAPRTSDMAGLSGGGSELNRVSQWRTFVEPGMPDEECVADYD